MNLKFISASACILLASLVHSQLGISKGENSNFQPHPNSSLHIDGSTEDGNKSLGVLLPNVENKSQLPLVSGSEDGYDDDLTMEGMLLFDKETASVNVYIGEIWEENKNSYNDPKLKQSRFLGKGDGSDQQNVACALILACDRHQILKFSHAIDGVDSYNNLGILRQNTTIRYGLINYTDENSKFVITQPGTYQIRINLPTLVFGVVSLTEGASYQLYAFKQDENGDHKEILLSSIVPNFPGVLGIGGGGKVGVGMTTTISLNPGDYVYTMIHSPSVTVSVASNLRAWDNGLFNPREIIFTKLD